jgi:hypothetical protein
MNSDRSVLFCSAVLCIVVRLTLGDSNTVLLTYYEALRLGNMRPVVTGEDNLISFTPCNYHKVSSLL